MQLITSSLLLLLVASPSSQPLRSNTHLTTLTVPSLPLAPKVSQPHVLHELKAIFRSRDDRSQQHVLQSLQHEDTPSVYRSDNTDESEKPQGVVAKHNKGTITLRSQVLEETVKMEFEFTLSNTKSTHEGCGTVRRPQENRDSARLELRDLKTSGGDRDAATLRLIQEVAEDMLSSYPSNAAVVDSTESRTVTTRSSVRQAGRSATLSLMVSYTEDAVSEANDLSLSNDKQEVMGQQLMTDRDEWSLIVGLVRSAATTLKQDVLGDGKGFSELVLGGKVYGLSFEASWKFEEVVQCD